MSWEVTLVTLIPEVIEGYVILATLVDKVDVLEASSKFIATSLVAYSVPVSLCIAPIRTMKGIGYIWDKYPEDNREPDGTCYG